MAVRLINQRPTTGMNPDQEFVGTLFNQGYFLYKSFNLFIFIFILYCAHLMFLYKQDKI